ncbi:MAG: GTPase [Candidatus Aenigmarchaeota archaeon]|nr:GTPase [Candidatus Aenigmarchaeota archaeon]
MKTNIIIMGAAGRDFHNHNVFFRRNHYYNVVCFTATQIPNISGRTYPKELAGTHYPKGIPIYPEEQLSKLIKKFKVDQVILAYSDLPFSEVMHKASLVNAAGADFRLMGPEHTMIKSRKPVIAVNAVRTGCGKSQTTRYIADILRSRGKRVVVVRHAMPYGSLLKQVCQRFETYEDLNKHNVTREEAEEYEPLIEMGLVVYAGVDYEKILRAAEKEADYIIFDGGNNDTSFFKPDIQITLTDPHRPGHEISYYPGETNLRMADVIIINKIKTARKKGIKTVRDNIKKYNPTAVVIEAQSEITVNNPSLLRNRRVLVVEDGPTLTHGGMPYGAGTIAAKRYNAKIMNPRPHLSGSLKDVFKKYPHLGNVLPAMGYSPQQVWELESTINKTPCDAVVSGTPIDLRRIIRAKKPIARIRYELKELGKPRLETILKKFTKPKH